MWASQTGKTGGILGNFIGYVVDRDPGPMLVIVPTLDNAKSWSKDRLMPLLRDTPALRGKVSEARSRDADSGMLHKRFRGGQLSIVGANSPASLAARPIRYLILDEVDRMPISAGAEGSPISLGLKRTVSFWNRKILMCSSPTTKNASAIEKRYQASDRRKYWVPCCHCGEFQILLFPRIEWEPGKTEEAAYRCEHCSKLIPHHQKPWMLLLGEWRAENPSANTAGFWINQLYSPFVSWEDTANEFLDAKGSPEMLRTFINTALCESWDDERETSTDEGALLARREFYPAEVPQGAVLLTAGIDVQDDSLHCEVTGWGLGEESWLIDYRIFKGDPSSFSPWSELDQYLLQPWRHESGPKLTVQAACIDSGGHFTNAVYGFCSARSGRRIFAIKGMSGSRPVWSAAPTRNTIAKHPLWIIGVDSAKASVMGRLRLLVAGQPGYCHFPASCTENYFSELTSEFLKTEYRAGSPVRTWTRKKGRRAEGLDTRVYSLAALEALKAMGMRLDKMSAQIASQAASLNPDYSGGYAIKAPLTQVRIMDENPYAPRRSNWMSRNRSSE